MGAIHEREGLVFTGVESAALVVVKKILLQLVTVGLNSRDWIGFP